MQKKNKLNPKDFVIQNQWFESLIKTPGSMHSQQFQISDCEQCSIIILDAVACIYIDNSKYCRVYVAASEAAIFVRDSEAVTVVANTKQFRTRNCILCDFHLFCETQPSIQSSEGMAFYPYPNWGYSMLQEQLLSANLFRWNNNWFDIYDFTPSKHGHGNYSTNTNCYTLGRFQQEFQKALQKNHMKRTRSIVPLCIGNQGKKIVVVVKDKQPTLSKIMYHQKLAYCSARKTIPDNNIKKCLGIADGSYLFIKVGRQEAWAEHFGQKALYVTDKQILDQLDKWVFLPFQDQH